MAHLPVRPMLHSSRRQVGGAAQLRDPNRNLRVVLWHNLAPLQSWVPLLAIALGGTPNTLPPAVRLVRRYQQRCLAPWCASESLPSDTH